ncbi:FtsW/RodA/SpoVE family cell cycle protein [Lysinibacillus telephonicus]|uniref:FtsW/RodA/SpoVE family cell cycle protein n=1 Tax=Lysinibacillus telephonicus TaxID=1714840 RepID=A0A431UAU9_9BACI|nr:FtsW/RodA/SpoVE family cell cycle protein [Lysinibacillus telephonicus]RTQ86220.1 FtsW/RodA/SpoVE family cell cycle protein [Lysinibacillus telephonicus]
MNISHFLETVTNEIKSKEAKQYVKVELSQHIQKSKQSWVQRGYSEIEAEEKAVKEMGSPITLGKSLNKLHRPKVDWLLISLLIVTLLLSFLPIMALNQERYLDFFNLNFSTMIQNKVIFIIIGLIVAIGIMYFDYRKLKRFGYLFYAAGVGLIIFLQLFTNSIVNGEQMISLGGIDIQVWMAIPLFLIAWASIFSNTSFKLWHCIGLFAFSIYLFLWIANLSMLFIYIVIVSVLFLQSKFSRKEKLLVVGAAAILMVGIIIFFTVSYMKGNIAHYQVDRLLGFIAPYEHASGSGYQYVTLENAIKNAGMFGTENIIYIPDADTILVFGNLIQTYGYALGIVIFVILSAFLARIWIILKSIKEPFGKLLIIGGATLFATQFLYSVGVTFGLLPLVSITLPFMSYGLMPTVLNAFIVGLVLSVYRRKHFIQIKREEKDLSSFQ